MNILGCLDRPTAGHYYLDGIDIADQTADELSAIRNKKIGFVFQAFNLIPRTSALKNVELPMIYAKIPTKERIARAQALLEKVGLGGAYGSHAQRALPAVRSSVWPLPRHWLMNRLSSWLTNLPAIWIRLRRQRSWSFSTQLNEEGVTVIIVTHEDDVAAFTKRVLWFEDGNLLSDKKVVKKQ